MASEFCFVIMPFTDELKPVYEDAIKPAIESEGLECVRVDEPLGPGNIVRRIIEHIHEARVVIADLTGKNANVFYEMGIAHALGNNVIVLAQDIKRDVPFDVGNYKVIQYALTWKGDQLLRDQIKAAIRAFPHWSASPSNPVQDFLPAGARPVPIAKYQEEAERAQKAQVELEAVREDLAKVKTIEEEVARLKQDNERLQGIRHFTETIFQNFLGRPVAGDDFEELMDRIQSEMDNKGEVTLDVGEARGGANEKKITFRKVR